MRLGGADEDKEEEAAGVVQGWCATNRKRLAHARNIGAECHVVCMWCVCVLSRCFSCCAQ
ncbi:hypothetical protein GBAR_LOCUS26754 [Geodia barretti]|uniref:Uncharacterized protein n=1 Tax=Geodia barretti TaxID=519541 RepID=A0AA35TIF1_GEOBA|nr:hypothetical protein GBAR_LOCUS26754 [Geodia barretti]